MTQKRRVSIQDDQGEHLQAFYVPTTTIDLENANLEGMIAVSVHTLRGRNFANSSLYSALLADSDLSGCNFENCNMRGANFKDTNLTAANLTNADLGVSNLGGSANLCGADLSSAKLHRTILEGAMYDATTRFPKGFDPDSRGMKDVS